jgi:hypothetical protein
MEPIKEFTRDEFKCQCGSCNYGYEDMDETFLSMLFTARKTSRVPFNLTSTVRCPLHKLARSNPTSSHNADRYASRKSKAVDIAAITSNDVYEIMEALKKAGFTRLGWNMDKKFIHVDSDSAKVQRVIFAY